MAMLNNQMALFLTTLTSNIAKYGKPNDWTIPKITVNGL